MKTQHRFVATFTSAIVVVSASSAFAADRAQLGQGRVAGIAGQQDVVKAVLAVEQLPVIDRSIRVGHADPSKLLHVSVSLPYADSQAMERFADSVSDPNSADFRKFITPEEVGARFGLPAERVQAVADWLASQGLTVNLVAKNRLAVLCSGTVDQFEKAFGTTIDQYSVDPLRAPEVEGGNTEFIAPSGPLHAPATIAGDILDVSGLETYTKPMPRTALTPTQTRGLYNSAPIYAAGYTGTGRAVGISNWDGFRLTNIPLYTSYYSLPVPAAGSGTNITRVQIGSSNGTTATVQGEADLDIQMVIGMAPLSSVYIYDNAGASDLVGVLTRETTDNICDIISESWGWNLPTATATSAHNQHLSMTTQGITYMAASGDSGTTLEPYSYPNYDGEVLMVGGTIAAVNTSNVRTGEVGWSGSGGGWTTKAISFNVRPSWQVGTGVPTTINYRMNPDVALHANGGATGAYPYYLNGTRTSAYSGTSFSCPVLAGMLATGEQKLIALGGLPANSAGKRRFGRMQNVIYAQNGRTDVYYDVISGTSNGTLPAAINGSTTSVCTAKWDTQTGWGAMNIDAFIGTQAPPPCPADLNSDHVVDGADLGILLANWGTSGPGNLDGTGTVDGADIGLLLAAWGNCP